MLQPVKRNQLEWAVWHVIDRGRMTASEPPIQVVYLMKRLIDLDRKMGWEADEHERGRQPYAFIERAPAGTGGENAYGLVDALALWTGVGLLEAGLPQKEIVEFLGEVRPQLRKAAIALLTDYGADVRRAAQLRSGAIAERLRKGELLAPSQRVYLVTESVTPSGVIAVRRRHGPGSNLCWGPKEMLAFIEGYGLQSRSFVVTEIGNAILSLAYLLLISEPRSRGPRRVRRRGG